MSVLTNLKNRGVEDIFIACMDGLTGVPDDEAGIHFTCWAGSFTNSDIIDIIGLQCGLNENDHVHKFEEAARIFGIEFEKFLTINL